MSKRPIYFDIFQDGRIAVTRDDALPDLEFIFKDLQQFRDFIKVCQMFADQCDASAAGSEWLTTDKIRLDQ